MDLIAIALAPVAFIIIYVYVKDKFEKEPKKLLLKSFLFGAIVSVLISTILYIFYDYALPRADDYSVLDQLFKAFIIVALTEEFSKYVIVRYYCQPKNAFNEPYDGIIYAVMVSMGFAAVENISYVYAGGMEVGILRAFTAVPAHATFGVLMGYYMGRAKFSNNKAKWNLVGLFAAVLFHGLYDFFLFIHFIPGISIGAFISLGVAIILSRKAIKAHQDNSYFNIR